MTPPQFTTVIDAEAPCLSWSRRLWLWLVTLFADHALFRLFYNLRTRVAPGLYRSSHPLPHQLRAAQRAGVASVLNLRGPEPFAANALEWDSVRRLGLPLVHVRINSREAPHRQAVLELLTAFDNLPKPILLHCKSGADRAGLASAIYLLDQEGADFPTAMRQMSFWRFGHVRAAKCGILDAFLKAWAAHHAEHGTAFRDWVANHYDRDAVEAGFYSKWWANQLNDRLLMRG